MITSDEILKNVNSVLEQEGKLQKEYSNSEKLEKFIIPALKNSKNTLESIYHYSPPKKFGFIGKMRNLAINKLKNVTLSVIEKPTMKQQKFNELAFQAIEILIDENKELKRKLNEK